MVGSITGDSDGLALGCNVGDFDVGVIDGLAVGLITGDIEGPRLGLKVGIGLTGLTDGDIVGEDVGCVFVINRKRMR